MCDLGQPGDQGRAVGAPAKAAAALALDAALPVDTAKAQRAKAWSFFMVDSVSGED